MGRSGRSTRLPGCPACRVPLDGDGIRIDRLGEAQVLHLSPSHHFPTGIVTPIGRRQALLEWAEGGEGRYLIEDDYDSEFRLAGRPIPTLQSIDRQEGDLPQFLHQVHRPGHSDQLPGSTAGADGRIPAPPGVLRLYGAQL